MLGVLTIILLTGPAVSYEFSIYDAYPWYFWVFLLSAIIFGQIIIFGSAIIDNKNNYWIFGLCAILIANTLLLCMPIIRGYYFSDNGDVLTHIGYMNDILQTLHISGNHYPVDHILGVIVHLITGLSLRDVTLIVPVIFSFFFIVSIYFVGKTIFKNRFEIFMLVILSSIVMFGNGQFVFQPNSQAFCLVPLMLFLAFKMYDSIHNKKYNILLLIISLLIVFFHPLVTVMAMLIFCLMQITQYILEKTEHTTLRKVNYIYISFFMLIVFSIWSTYLTMTIDVIEPIFNRIFGTAVIESELQNKISLISQVNIDPVYLLKLTFNIFGQSILLGILSLVCIAIIFKSTKHQETKFKFFNGVLILEFLIISLLSIVIFLMINQFGFRRIFHFAQIFSMLLIPTGIYLFLYNKQNNIPLTSKTILKLFAILFIFFGITYFSIFNLYNSPIVKQANQQVTKSDYIGMSTFFTYRDESLPISELGLVSYRFYDTIYGHLVRQHKKLIQEYLLPPNHFGYQNKTLSQIFYNDPKYLLLNEQGIGLNPYINPEFESKWSFSPQDFIQLKFDEKIHEVYTNGHLEIFMIS